MRVWGAHPAAQLEQCTVLGSPSVRCQSSQALQEEAGTPSLISQVPDGFVLLQGLHVSRNSLGMAAVCRWIFHLCKLNYEIIPASFFFLCRSVLWRHGAQMQSFLWQPTVRSIKYTHTHMYLLLFLRAATIYSETCKLYLHFLAESSWVSSRVCAPLRSCLSSVLLCQIQLLTCHFRVKPLPKI